MLSEEGGSPTLARDTVFAVVMIVCNGLVGLCMDFPPRSGGFCKEPEHPRRAKWHTDDPGDGLRVSIRPNRFSA
jgi:hypothetical protein